MDPKKRKRRRFLILALLVVGVIAATSAYAFWTSGGSGSGNAATGTTANVTVNQTGAAITGLYPGGAAKPLAGNFDNPNTGPVTISSVTGNVTGTSSASCGAANFAITGSSVIGGGGVVPAGTGVGSWNGLSIQMLETGVDQDACKNVTVNIAYTAA